MRRLSPEERALWGRLAATVTPLKPGQRGTAGLEVAKPGVRAVPVSASAPPPTRAIIAPLRHVSANTLDGGWDKRLAKGAVIPDMTIDLHGETLSSAHARLNRSLDAAIRHGARLILLITGRPPRDNPRLPPVSRGVIRASIADWLAASPHAGRIAAVRNAHPRHGGAGALYLVIRRPR